MVSTLQTRSVIRMSGEDAEKLLNDTLTGFVRGALEGEGSWFALLAPQGKILAEGLLVRADGAYWADLEAGVSANFLKRMRMYKLRAKFEIEDVSDSYLIAWASTPDALAGITYRDARSEGLGFRAIVPRKDGSGTAPDDDWAKRRIAVGVPELGPDFAADEVFPHDIGMDHLGGVDFKKGCFVGQEVVSRMQHRGTARRRPAVVSGIPAGVPAGTALTVDGRTVGTLGDSVDGLAVAIVRIDKVTPESPVMVGDTPVQLALPEWARYRFAESAGAADD